MLDQDLVAQQSSLLTTHRRTLAALLQQLALLGGQAYAPPGVINGIEEARENILRIKLYLRENGVEVADEPIDDAPLPAAPMSPPIVGSGSYTTDQAYDVHGEPCPYLGLRSFTYDDRDYYVGRQRLVEEAVQKLTSPGEQRAFLLITGASGCGKSSFVQAGLLPALESFYARRKMATAWAVFRPSRHPLAGMVDALSQLVVIPENFNPQDLTATFGAVYRFLQQHALPQQINLLIIDQFEELFTQSEPAETIFLLRLLEDLPSFRELRTHIIATLRSDFLPEVFKHKTLYDEAKRGIDLRAMTEAEIKQAICRPLQRLYPKGEKKIEDALVASLARDTAGDAAYLPLLQATLEDIWSRGTLKISAYGTLTDAIQRRAEEVYMYSDYMTYRQTARPEGERSIIMQIFIDLIDVSLDDDLRRVVRYRRTFEELRQGSPEREHIIKELIDARLLSSTIMAAGATQIEVVDIIHESLIRNWDRLGKEIIIRRRLLQQRVRFQQALQEWLAVDRNQTGLLSGLRLAEAQELNQLNDIALRSPAARELLRRSLEQQAADRQEQSQGAYIRMNQARQVLNRDPVQSMFLMAEAITTMRRLGEPVSLQMEHILHLAVLGSFDWLTLNGHSGAVRSVTYSPDGRFILTAGVDKTARIWDATSGQVQQILSGHTAWISSASYSPNGHVIVTTSADVAYIWDVATKELLMTLTGHTGDLNTACYSPDGRFLVTASEDMSAKIWDATTGRELRALTNPTGAVTSARYSPDGRFLVTASSDMTAKIWDAATGQELRTLKGHKGPVYSASYSPDGRFLVTASSDMTAKIWDAATEQELQTILHSTGSVYSAEYRPDGRTIVTASSNMTAQVWDVTTGKRQLELARHIARVNSAVYSPDGRFIATASDDGTAQQYVMDIDELLRLAQQRLRASQ